MPSLSIHLLMDIYVASNVLAIINRAAMNTVVHVSFSIMAFLGYMPLGQEDPLEEGMATHSLFLPRKFLDRGTWRAAVHRITKSWT